MSERTPTALVLLAAGAEEMETVITVDVLRRAGVEVTLAGIEGPDLVRCSRGVRIHPDASLEELDDRLFDAVVLPGGLEGARRLADSVAVGEVLRRHLEASRLVAAICAAPTALVKHGLFGGATMTSHPSVRAVVAGHATPSDERVVDVGPLVTSQGPGTTFEFALTLVSRLVSPEKADEIALPMILAGRGGS